jgi:hypothetical protein
VVGAGGAPTTVLSSSSYATFDSDVGSVWLESPYTAADAGFAGVGTLRRVIGEKSLEVVMAPRQREPDFERRWACLGSNQGPPACEAGALPLSYTP